VNNRGMMCVNSLPKTVTRQRRGCDLNPGPSAPESSTLTVGYRATPVYMYFVLFCVCVCVCVCVYLCVCDLSYFHVSSQILATPLSAGVSARNCGVRTGADFRPTLLCCRPCHGCDTVEGSPSETRRMWPSTRRPRTD